MLCIVLFTQYLEPFITLLPNGTHCYLIFQNLEPSATPTCGEQTKVLNAFGKVTGYKYCQMQEVLCLTEEVLVRERLSSPSLSPIASQHTHILKVLMKLQSSD